MIHEFVAWGVTRKARLATKGLVKSYPMAAPAFSAPNQNAARLADPALREALLEHARRRLPPGEVEDLVQNVLTEALVSVDPPHEASAFRRWVLGIARHEIADTYRRRGRQPLLEADVDDKPAVPEGQAGELTQWIERELPRTDGAQATLHWLLRESDGESLDEIARDAALPAPRVRQRVSRLRRHFHARWLALGAASLVLLLGAGWLFHATRASPKPPPIARESVPPLERARLLRDSALEQCAAGHYQECVARLDQAKALDPNGDATRAISEARSAAGRALAPAPTPLLPTPKHGAKQMYRPKTGSIPKGTKPVPESVYPSQPNAAPSKLAPSKKGSYSKEQIDFDEAPSPLQGSKLQGGERK